MSHVKKIVLFSTINNNKAVREALLFSLMLVHATWSVWPSQDFPRMDITFISLHRIMSQNNC